VSEEYLVRFSLRVSADNPGDAVDGVVDLFVEKGLRDWVYRVDNPSLEGPEAVVGYFDGYGVPVDVAELLAQSEQIDPIPVGGIVAAASDDGPRVTDDPDDDDVELLAEAESLNQANDKPVPSNAELMDESIREYSE
jgi:hypothetical protein